MNMEKNILEISVNDILPNRSQPRIVFDSTGINELSESIKEHGIIQPLIVRKLGDKYELIAGERRYKAAVEAGLQKVPVIISDINSDKSAEVALVENIQRKNLTAIEEARSYKNLLDKGYLTQEQLANKMGISQSSVANKLRLLQLAPEVQEALLTGQISERHARALLCLESTEEQKNWLNRIINERLTVKELDDELKKMKNNADEERDIVPLVEINPNLDNIINVAQDIKIERAPHDVASFLLPDGWEPEPEKKEEVPVAVPDKFEPMPNRFFNFLEEEEANMNISNEEIVDVFKKEPIPVGKTEVLDANVSNFVIETPVEPEISNEVIENVSVPTEVQNNNINNNDINNIVPEVNNQPPTFPNIFFNNEEPKIDNTPKVEPVNNNQIEEIIPVPKEELVDPLDSIVMLEPDYQQKQEELAGTDLKTAINTLRDTVNNLEIKGFDIAMEEIDLEGQYHINIRIMK